MKAEIAEKAKTFDSDVSVKSLVDETLQKLWIFRKQYPFAENPDSIGTLTPEDIFKLKDGKMEDFFHYIEFYLKARFSSSLSVLVRIFRILHI
jgi:hypothetical protein